MKSMLMFGRNDKWVCMNMNQFNDNNPEKVEIPA